MRISRPQPPPADGEVHVWDALLPLRTSKLRTLAALLTPRERARADRILLPEKRNHFIATRGILRTLLAQYLQRPATRISLGTTPSGKPFVKNSDLSFNLSHSSGRVLFAFTRRGRIGVDLESSRAKADPDEIVKRFFPPQEARLFQRIPQNRRRALFLQVWTRKEAVIKAMGGTLAPGLRSIRLPMTRELRNHLLTLREKRRSNVTLTISDLTMTQGFFGSLAVETREPLVHRFRFRV